MTDKQVTMATCPHCDQPVQPSRHTPEECRDKMRAQRDEARAVAAGLLSHLAIIWGVAEEMAQTIDGQQKEVTRIAKRFYPWLKEQATVDAEEGSNVH